MRGYTKCKKEHKLYNRTEPNDDWIDLHFQQNHNDRNNMFHIVDYSRVRVGKIILTERMRVLNDKINLDWLNQSFSSFKIKCKPSFWQTNDMLTIRLDNN